MHIIVLQIMWFEKLSNLQGSDASGVVWSCKLKTVVLQAPKWWMEEEIWLSNAWLCFTWNLPWMKLFQNSSWTRLYSWDIPLAMSSKMVVGDEATKLSSRFLRFLQEKFKNARWGFERIWGFFICLSIVARAFQREKDVYMCCLRFVNQD